MSTQENDEEDQHRQALTASVRDLRHFATLLRGISFAKKALIQINEIGLVVTVEEARTFLGVAYIHKDVFDEYAYRSEDDAQDQDSGLSTHTVFEIQILTLLESLNIFGTAGGAAASINISKQKYRGWSKPNPRDAGSDSDGGGRRGKSGRSTNASGRIDQYLGSEKGTRMRMTYAGPGYPLTLLIAEDADGPTATCEVTTYEADPVLDLPYDADATVLKIILKSSWLYDALSELHPSCDKLTIIGNPPPPPGRAPNINAPPRLRLKATGTFGSSEMDYPSDKEVLESCECPVSVSFTYKCTQVLNAVKALQSSLKTSLRIDEEGLMSLQLMVPGVGSRGKASDAFIEFRCLAIDEGTQS